MPTTGSSSVSENIITINIPAASPGDTKPGSAIVNVSKGSPTADPISEAVCNNPSNTWKSSSPATSYTVQGKLNAPTPSNITVTDDVPAGTKPTGTASGLAPAITYTFPGSNNVGDTQIVVTIQPSGGGLP